MKASMTVMLFMVAEGLGDVLRHLRVEDTSEAVGAVLEATSLPTCSLILFADGVTSPSNLLKAVTSERVSPRGVTVMEMTADGQDANVTMDLLSHLVSQARRIRRDSWCVSVVVLSQDPAFLVAFAESSLKGRLLVWATRLLVVTSLTLPQLQALMPFHWCFSLMNSIFLNLENTLISYRVSVYTHLPHTHDGPRMMRIASWSPERGLFILTKLKLFHEKYNDFQGDTIPVSVLPFSPYWVEEEHKAADGTAVKTISGTDGEMLQSVAHALNFTFRLLPVKNWAEVVQRVEERKAYIVPMYYAMLPQRLERYDMTYPYEYSFLAFSMRKPGLRPRWQSLYYPLSEEVWATIFVFLLSVPVVLIMIIRAKEWMDGDRRIDGGVVVQDMTGILLGQNLPRRLPSTHSSRLVVAAWLVFAFIFGTAFRGNLTAHLTLPKYPPRPETIEELVEAVDKITGGSYLAPFKAFYSKSSNVVFQKLGELFFVGPSVEEGLQQALDYNQAVIGGLRNMGLVIAENFTEPDGSSKLYWGREYVLPGMSAWPIPHDAPYRSQLDRCMKAIIEGGFYEQWSNDQMMKASRRSRMRHKEYLAQKGKQQQQQQGQEEQTESDNSDRALTLQHMQGLLILLSLGLIFAALSYIIEIIVHSHCSE